MGAGHGHGGGAGFAAPARVRAVLGVVVGAVLAAALAGLVLLWPSEADAVRGMAAPAGTEEVVTGVVRSAAATTCEGDSSDRLPDGTIPETATCASAEVLLGSGPDEGAQVRVAVPAPVYRAGLVPGDEVQVVRYPALGDAEAATGANPDALPDGTVYAWVDFARGAPLSLLAVAFAVLVVAVARLRGLAAIAGLALAYLTIVRFMLPALRQGENAVAVALVGSVLVMTVVLYLAHGVSARTTTALLGTFFGLAMTAGLAVWATSAAHLTGLSSEENHVLSQITGQADLSGIILCGVIVAGLGVLNDVTITQAAAVWEVQAHAPGLGFRRLFLSGMRVGRDHLASTVYTIAFAYAGAALPTLILIDLYGRPLGQVLTSGEIAEEVVRTLVGAIGLVLAIPVTTALAAAVVASAGAAGVRARPSGRRARGRDEVSSSPAPATGSAAAPEGW